MFSQSMNFPDNSTDANFRAWGLALSNALAAAGLVKIVGVGEINFATVTRPLAINTVQGYEIWRLADALQATSPFFIKIEYGSGPNTAYASLWITAGTGQDGAGNITGIFSTRAQVASNGSSAVIQYASSFTGGTNRFACILFAGSPGYQLGFSIERLHDAAGADIDEGLYVVNIGNAAATSQVVPKAGLGAATVAETPVGVLPANRTYGADIAVSAIYPARGRLLNPSVNLLGYVRADIVSLSTISITLYGVVTNFLAASGTSGGGFLASANNFWLLRAS